MPGYHTSPRRLAVLILGVGGLAIAVLTSCVEGSRLTQSSTLDASTEASYSAALEKRLEDADSSDTLQIVFNEWLSVEQLSQLIRDSGILEMTQVRVLFPSINRMRATLPLVSQSATLDPETLRAALQAHATRFSSDPEYASRVNALAAESAPDLQIAFIRVRGESEELLRWWREHRTSVRFIQVIRPGSEIDKAQRTPEPGAPLR